MCAWASISPGIRVHPDTSITDAPSRGSGPEDDTDAMREPSTTTSKPFRSSAGPSRTRLALMNSVFDIWGRKFYLRVWPQVEPDGTRWRRETGFCHRRSRSYGRKVFTLHRRAGYGTAGAARHKRNLMGALLPLREAVDFSNSESPFLSGRGRRGRDEY